MVDGAATVTGNFITVPTKVTTISTTRIGVMILPRISFSLFGCRATKVAPAKNTME